MTRINVAVKPAELNDKMLIAEHREIKRIPNCIRKGRYSLDGQPASFKLGTGHVKVFLRQMWLPLQPLPRIAQRMYFKRF